MQWISSIHPLKHLSLSAHSYSSTKEISKVFKEALKRNGNTLETLSLSLEDPTYVRFREESHHPLELLGGKNFRYSLKKLKTLQISLRLYGGICDFNLPRLVSPLSPPFCTFFVLRACREGSTRHPNFKSGYFANGRRSIYPYGV